MFRKIIAAMLILLLVVIPFMAFADDTTSSTSDNTTTSTQAVTSSNNTTVSDSVYDQSSGDSTTIQNPQIDAINSQIQELEQELETAINNNQFAKALEISNKIKALEQKLKTLSQNDQLEAEIADLKTEAINDFQNSQIDDAINIIKQIISLKHSQDNYALLGKIYHMAKKDNTPHVFANGKEVLSDVNPMIYNNRTYIPLRAVANAIGVDNNAISWDNNNRTVNIKTGNINIYMPVNTTNIKVNGNVKAIDAPAIIYKNRVMVPLRAISQLFNKSVNWYQEGQIATVGD